MTPATTSEVAPPSSLQSLPERVIGVSIWKLLGLLLIGLGFVALGLGMLYKPGLNVVMKIIGGMSAAFFGLCAYVALRQLIKRPPGLTLNAEGFCDQSAGVSAGWVPWKNVSGIEATTLASQKFVSVMLHDQRMHTEHPGLMHRKMAQWNTRLVGTSVNVSANVLQISFKDLLALMRHYHAQSQGLMQGAEKEQAKQSKERGHG